MATAIGKKRGRKPASKPKPRKKVSGANSATPKRNNSVGASNSGTTKVFNGKRYSLQACHTSTEAAQNTAAKARSNGKLARVVNGCVYTRNKK